MPKERAVMQRNCIVTLSHAVLLARALQSVVLSYTTSVPSLSQSSIPFFHLIRYPVISSEVSFLHSS